MIEVITPDDHRYDEAYDRLDNQGTLSGHEIHASLQGHFDEQPAAEAPDLETLYSGELELGPDASSAVLDLHPETRVHAIPAAPEHSEALPSTASPLHIEQPTLMQVDHQEQVEPTEPQPAAPAVAPAAAAETEIAVIDPHPGDFDSLSALATARLIAGAAAAKAEERRQQIARQEGEAAQQQFLQAQENLRKLL